MIKLTQLSLTTGDRSPLVLLHAFPFSNAMWGAAAERLQKFQPDLPVYGAEVPGFGKAAVIDSWTMKEAATALQESLRTLNAEQSIICGLSMGGYLAFQFYKDFPDCVKALIFCDTKAAADTEKAKEDRERFATAVLARGSSVSVEMMYEKMLAPSTYGEHAALAEKVKRWMLEANPRATAAALRAMAERSDSKELLPLINVPTLVIRGEHDAVSSHEDMRAIHEHTLGSRYAEIKDAGHLSAVEKPEEWADIVSQFLDSLA